jgi:hypothetical protein
MVAGPSARPARIHNDLGENMRSVRPEYFLTIGEIAMEYERNGHDRLHALFNAFWRGTFEPFIREGAQEYPLVSRRRMLEIWHEIDDHPGLHFATSSEGQIEQLPDGTIDVEVSTRIVLPAETADWKPKELQTAYDQLANVSISDISEEAVTGLKCQFLGAYELLAACHELGEQPPPFWKNWDSTGKISRKDKAHFFREQARAAIWLREKLKDIPQAEVRRASIRSEAATDHGLSGASFDKLWKPFASEELQKGGRRRGS